VRVGQARKRDANEPGIVQALERCGLRVARASMPGFPDLVVYGPRIGVRLLEVKSKSGTLTPAQVQHTVDGWPVFVVRSVEDALAAVEIG
jgi:hypothetical protein